jgi:hypothetical protein
LEVSEYFGSHDFYVGAIVVINGFEFHIYDADEYAFKLMEKELQLFPVSNQRLILEKLRRLLTNNADSVAQFEQHDPQRRGHFGYETFFYLMKNLAGNVLVEHEIITLARAYAQPTVKEHDIYSIVGVAQEHLRKNNYEHLTPLKENLMTRDRQLVIVGIVSCRSNDHLCSLILVAMAVYKPTKYAWLYVLFMFHCRIIFSI